MLDLTLRHPSSEAWLDTVLADFDAFLLDHASCEKKASGMAMSIIAHYPDKPALVSAMLNLAVEELSHYRDVMRLVLDLGLTPGADRKDTYINRLHAAMDQGRENYLLDRLLVAAVVEARGAERFGLVAGGLADPKLQRFYQAITDSESRHYRLFLDLATNYYPRVRAAARLGALLAIEAEIVRTMPLRAALH